MNELTMETLARRLDKVERKNRRLKQVGLLVLAVIGAAMVMGQATGGKVAKLVEAEKFVLRDANGKRRAMLESLPGGLVRLALFSENERVQSVLGVGTPGTPSLVLTDTNSKTILTTSFLSVSDQRGKGRLTLAVLPSGGQSVILADRTGRTRAELAIEVDGSSALNLYDKTGMARAVLGSFSLENAETGVIEKRPESSLVLFGNNGKGIWSAP